MVKKIIERTKSILFDNPRALYKKDKSILNEAFYFKGTNRKGVLLIHGWTTTPYEVRRLGKFINENRYTVYAPLLSGHGTVPKDLEGITGEDWISDAEKAYFKMKKECDEVFVIGTSLGSTLAVIINKKHAGMKGIILMAMPYRLRKEFIVIKFAQILSLFKKYYKKRYPASFGESSQITRQISYQIYPIASSLEVFKLIKRCRECIKYVENPCLIIQSSSDHIVSKDCIDEIYDNIPSKSKKKKIVKRAYHTFISDIKNEHVFQDILKFLNET